MLAHLKILEFDPSVKMEAALFRVQLIRGNISGMQKPRKKWHRADEEVARGEGDWWIIGQFGTKDNLANRRY